jgi:hypothetical protein
MPTHLILLDLITLIMFGEMHKSTSYLIGSDVLLSTLFLGTFSQCSSLSGKDLVSHTYKTTGKIMTLYFSQREEGKTRSSELNDNEHCSQTFGLCHIFKDLLAVTE